MQTEDTQNYTTYLFKQICRGIRIENEYNRVGIYEWGREWACGWKIKG